MSATRQGRTFSRLMSFQLDHLGLTHGNGHRALAGVSLAAVAGEKIAIIGPSGAGKTSLIRLIASSLRPTEGRITTLEVSPWQLGAGELKALRARIGVIHQTPPIPPRLRVVTAVLAGRLGQWPAWKSLASLLYPADIAGARAALAKLDLADRLFDRCDRLSGGQLQRVGLARVLYQQPALVLADEPVSAMDPALADHAINQLITDASARGATLVASLHAVDLALKWFPRVIGIKAGEVMFDLPPVKIDDALLRELYSSEGSILPTQGNDPLLHDTAPRVVEIRRPLCA
jgi:phosphonate transport system ATP-binding protein